VLPLPRGLTARRAMAVGTAGFTAALCVDALVDAGVKPGGREVVVTGAAGGVGSVAVALLAKAGFRVAASTGRPEEHAFLERLGATRIVPRAELAKPPGKPLEAETSAARCSGRCSGRPRTTARSPPAGSRAARTCR
jgi:acrylyl-CoA reductase (NADPH)